MFRSNIRFGKIICISINLERRTALIRFSNVEEAAAARNCNAPVMGASTIKVTRLKFQPKSPPIIPMSIADKRNYQHMKSEFEKEKAEFLKGSVQKIAELKQQLVKAKNADEAIQISSAINLINLEMDKYTRRPLATLGKRFSPSFSTLSNKSSDERPKIFEVMLENIDKKLQNYKSLIEKLRVRF